MDIAFEAIGNGFTQIIKSESVANYDAPSKGPDFNQLAKKIHEETKRAKKQIGKLDRSIEAYFIGPRGQNIDFFSNMIHKAIDSHLSARVEYQIQDARHISRRMKNEPSFLDAQDRLERALNMVLTKMKDLTPPFFSSRYFGHMIWETTIPSIVGNFATLLYNPNNCAYEASPFTTILQIEVMTEFAKMFGFPSMLGFNKGKNSQKTENSWGHLTCGGTIANCEAMWASRNCKFLSLSIRKYIESIQNKNNIKDITVKLVNGQTKKLLQISAWQILNISNQQTMNLYDFAYRTLYGENAKPEEYSIFQNGVADFSIGKVGLIDMYDWISQIHQARPQAQWKSKIPRPKVFVSATAHYSLRKSLSILGLGQKAVQKVVVDLDSRISIKALTAKLQECVDKKIPVLSVIGIVGTTEQSTVDSLQQIWNLKQQFAKKGLYFHFHIDGAYGGYFVSMIRGRQENHLNSYSSFVQKQLLTFCKADSITFDPHKTGYVPYSCGGIIYRNHRLRDNLSFSAPYIYTGAQPNMSIYGVQGSKPGSSVTSVYLSLQVLPLVRAGHGELLERTMMNTKIFTASLYKIRQIDVQYTYEKGEITKRFECFLLPRLFCEKSNKTELRQAQLKTVYKVSESSPQGLLELVNTQFNNPDQSFQNVYYNLGPDLNIVCYGMNFIDKTTQKPNRSLKNYNTFNRTLIKLSKPVGSDVSVRMKDLYVSQTQINKHAYGEEIFNDFLKRHNLEDDGQEELVLIRSTIMNAFFTEGVNDGSRIQSSNNIFIRQLLQNCCQTLIHLNWQ